MADKLEFVRVSIGGAGTNQVVDQKPTGSDVPTVNSKSNVVTDKNKAIVRDSKVRLGRKEEELKSILSKMNDVMKIFDIERRYQMEKVMHQVVVKFVDVRENKIIDQIPPEEVIRRYHRMLEYFRKVFGL